MAYDNLGSEAYVPASEVRTMALTIEREFGKLRPGMNVRTALRDRLEELALGCGMPRSVVRDATSTDLVSVQLTAVKDPQAARRVAERVTIRLTGETPQPAPRPYEAPQPGASVDTAAVLGIVRDELQAHIPALQNAIEIVDETLRGDFAHMGVQIRVDTLDAVRGEIQIAAQAAAVAAIQSMQPTRLEVQLPGAPDATQLGLVHFKTPQIINALAAGVNVYLHGPAGSGKTTVARKCADAFGVEFYFAAKVESEYQLMGFKDAKGETVRTQFREAYEHGGVFLFDEMDASSPSAVVALNAALANGVCPFPDMIVKRHAQFYCIGAGNTKLTGANRQYAGRNQLDAASIDRFMFIEFGYDDDLERALATDATWCAYVQAVRRAVAERGLNHLVTPRATYDGCRLLAAGFDWDTVATMAVYKGLDSDTVRQIESALDYSR